jgi:hypothetical protein
MLLTLKNYQQYSQINRCFWFNNLHQIFSIKKLTFFYTLSKDISLKALIRVSAFMELITDQRAFFIRSKTSSILLKVRKGAPLGVKINLRKKKLFNFLMLFIWQVLPFSKNLITKKETRHVKKIIIKIVDPLTFPVLKNFYFFFKTCINLRIFFTFGVSSNNQTFFTIRFLQLPF